MSAINPSLARRYRSYMYHVRMGGPRDYVPGLALRDIAPDVPAYVANDPGDVHMVIERDERPLRLSARVRIDDDGDAIVSAWIRRHGAWTAIELDSHEEQLVIDEVGDVTCDVQDPYWDADEARWM